MTLENTAISRHRPPELIPGYKLESLLGKGGMGEVHKAVQLSLGRTVAVKLLASELAQDKSFVHRFEKEAAALATLSHPNIVAIVDKGKASKTYYLVMEFVDGPSLREVMRAPTFEIPEALKLAFDVCRAIDYAHGRGVIHRDLKPENILVDEQAGGIPKVSDFGLAGFTDDGPSKFNLTETHVAMGTQAYMAPEQRVDAKNADHRADIYSLGVMLYELLVGEVPVGHFSPPSQRRTGVDTRLDAIVERCLKPSPGDRYQKVSELIADLLPMVPVSFSKPPTAANPVARLRWWIGRKVRFAARAVGYGLVLAACAVLAVSWLRARIVPTSTNLAGALAPDLAPKASATVRARVTEGDAGRRIRLGEGPDKLSLVGAGREAALKGQALSFAAPEGAARVGRARLDLTEQGADSVELRARLGARAGELGLWTRLRAWARGEQLRPRAAVVLQGTPGRYVAVILDGSGGPARLEWAFGERRGAMTGSQAVARAEVELEVERDGTVRAFLTSGPDRRQLAEPIALGSGWRKYFGRTPVPEVACLDGACELSELQYLARRDPPPPPPAPKPAPVAKPATHKPAVRAPTRAASVKRTTSHTKRRTTTSHKRRTRRRR